MKRKPQHCAHVADYHAAMAQVLGSDVGWSLRLKHLPLPGRPDYHYGGAKRTLEEAELHLKFVKLAAKEWIRAGGAA